jgi:RimJ/RimL family protein N-acetyltransferase
MALPTFATARLTLRPRAIGDYDACLAMDRDPAVVRYIAGPWADAKAHAVFLRDRITRSYPDGLGYWCIFSKTSPHRFLGWVLLIPRDTIGPEVEIGWRLVGEAWGRGYAPEAAAAIVRHAFETVGLERIIAEIHPDNTRSARVAEKIGFRRVERGQHIDYEMTRDRFTA